MLGGNEGRDLSNLIPGPPGRLAAALAFFFLRRCIKDSWQSMQNIPWEVRA